MRNFIGKYLVVILLALGVGGLVTWFLVTPEFESVRPANMGTKSFDVGFFTKKLSKGCVIVMSEFNPLSWQKTCEKEKRKTHLIRISNLDPDQEYQLVLVNGLRIKTSKVLKVKTGQVNDQAPVVPNPAFGSVVGRNRELVPGSLVYIYPYSSKFSYPVATITNFDGNYAVDLGLLENVEDILIIEAIASAGIWNNIQASVEWTEPLPAITVILR